MKLFTVMGTALENFDSTVKTYLTNALGSLGMSYSNNQVFGVIFETVKGVMQNIMFYIEDAFTEQNIFTAYRKKSIYSLAKQSGYEPSYGYAATGTIIGKPLANTQLDSGSTKVYIQNYTVIKNNTTGIFYSIILPTDEYVIDITKPLLFHEFKIVEGSMYKMTSTASGAMLDTTVFTLNGNWDKNYVKVYVNGELWEPVSCLYDMTYNSKNYIMSVGYDNEINVTFGNGTYGSIPTAGSTILMEYITHSGIAGNVYSTDNTAFVFIGPGYDGLGNAVNLNNYMSLTMQNCISGGVNSDTVDFVKQMVGCNSRSLVFASEDNFKLFFNRFSFIGHVNCWSEENSMCITASCLSTSFTKLTNAEDYFNLTDEDLLLTDSQKEMIQTTLDNSKRIFAGVTLKFQDPIIRRYAIICYVKVNSTYSKESVRTNISNIIANYFLQLQSDTLFIPKSDIITAVTNADDNIKSFDIDIISDLAERTYKDGYYYKYVMKYANNTYSYEPKKVWYEQDTYPGLDMYGNIQLDSKLEVPILGSGITYYSDKTNKNNSIKLDAIQFVFI